MNYTEVVNAMKNASLFDLYRLSIAIGNEMQNPERIRQVRSSFKDGDTISYFDAKSNALLQARVLQKNPKYITVENVSDHKHWNIPYCALNLDNIDVDIQANNNTTLSKNNLKVGDFVGFNKDGLSIAGVITRLNQKTVSLVANDNRRWRVAYVFLYRIIDADIVNQFDPRQIATWIQEENNRA